MTQPHASLLHDRGSDHLDGLLERALSGTATGAELGVLQAHTKDCAACAALLELGPQLAARLVESKPDPERDQRAVVRALAAPHHIRSRRAAVIVGLPAAALLFGSLAAAQYLGVLLPRASTTAATSSPNRAPAPLGEGRAPRHAEPPRTEEPGKQVSAVEPAAPESAAPGARATTIESASELFAQGNQLRRSARDVSAIQAYRRLQQAYPQSNEATLSYAMLGALLLQRGDAQGALAQFDGYVARGGPVLEEALAGRARALGQLADRTGEIQAWEQLVDRFPSSVHATRARARLAELR